MHIRMTTAATLALSSSLLAWTPEASALTLPGVTDACYTITVGNADVPPIPAGFFGPGSEPFISDPLQDLHLTPTDPALPPFCSPDGHPPIDLFQPDPTMPDPSVVSIELVQLNLQSVEPIQVLFDDGTTVPFDMFVTVTGLPPQPGELTAFPPGQFTVDSFFDIAYQIDFVDPLTGIPAGEGPIFGQLPMISQPMPWFHDIGNDLLIPGFDGNILSPFEFVSPTGGMRLTGVADIPSPLQGDLDGDGFVGINDLNIVLSHWNQSVPPADPAADPSGDGFVGIDDLNEVLSNWNASAPPAANAVPEPASVALLGLASALLLRREH